MNEAVRNIIIVIIALIVLIALILGIWAIANAISDSKEPQETETDAPLVPDTPPEQADPNQEPLETKEDESFANQGVRIDYKGTAVIDLSDGMAEIYFANPKKSTQNMVISLVIDNTVVCQSQKILTGNSITKIGLLPEAKDRLSEGTYKNAKFVVGCYDPVTNEKSFVEPVIDNITVTVVQ